MTEPQGEWLDTPGDQQGSDSEWTTDPLPPRARAPRSSPRKGVSIVVSGGLAVLAFVVVGMFLVLRSIRIDVYDPSHAADMAAITSPHQSPTESAPKSTPPVSAVPAKPKESTEAVTRWVSAPASGLPQIDLALASGPLPSTLKLGNPITVEFEATCLATGDEKPGTPDGRTRGGISVSVDGDATLSSPSAGADHYGVGSPITVYDNGSVWISNQHAKNELVEKTAKPWRKGRVLSLRVVVTPTKPGDLTLFARSTATLRKRPVSSTEGSSTSDQQGLPVQAFHVTITE